MSRELHASAGAVGSLVTAYAVIVALTAVPATALTGHWDRRTAVVAAAGTIAVSTGMTSLCTSVWLVAAVRSIAAVGHGVFWSVVASLAARLSPPGRAGSATATVFAANSLAFVVGVPGTSALGALLGWRAAFVTLTVLAVALTAALLRWVPRAPADAARRPGSLRTALAQRGPALVTAATLLVVFGNFAAFAYITELVQHWTGWSGTRVSAVLLANGVAGAVGAIALRTLIDARPRRTAMGVVLGLGLVAGALVLAGSVSPALAVALIAVWGAPTACIATVLQAGVLRAARPGTVDLASAGYVVAFQIGIALGAFAGGRLVDGRAPAATLIVTAAAVALAAPLVLAARTAFPVAQLSRPQRAGITGP